MSEDRQKRGFILVCKECGQVIPGIDHKKIITKALDKLRREMGFGEKCKIKQGKGSETTKPC